MNSVAKFKIVQGEWLFQKILDHLGITEEEFKTRYEKRLEDDPTCLNGVIINMMHKNMNRG